MGVTLHAHPIHGELHIQHNANQEVETICREAPPPLYVTFTKTYKQGRGAQLNPANLGKQ